MLTIHWLLSHGVVFTITQSSPPFPSCLPVSTPPIHYSFLPTLHFFSPPPAVLPSYVRTLLPSSPVALPFRSPLLPFMLDSPFLLFPPHSFSPPLLLPLVLSLPAHLDLSGSSTGDDLSRLPFCKEPALPSEGEGLSLDHMSVSERSGRGNKGEGKEG